ncbi:hypothetical protein K8I28_03695 [bacterium]|nr:hypothetical protein [bacterium]
METNTKKSNKELRKFGITLAIGFAVIGGLLFWRGHDPQWKVMAGICAFFLVSGLIIPMVLRPIEWAWMKLAHVLGMIMTYIIVSLTFFLVITPVGLLVRLVGKDLLSLKFDKNAKTYWEDVDPEGPSSRPDKPY